MKTHWFPVIRPAIKLVFLGPAKIHVPFLLFRPFWGIGRPGVVWSGWNHLGDEQQGLFTAKFPKPDLGVFAGGIFQPKKARPFSHLGGFKKKNTLKKYHGLVRFVQNTPILEFFVWRIRENGDPHIGYVLVNRVTEDWKNQKSIQQQGCWMDFCTLSSQICWKHSLKINGSSSAKWRQMRNAFPFQMGCFAGSSR